MFEKNKVKMNKYRLNKGMWIQEMGELYEAWNPGTNNAPRIAGVPVPTETRDSIRMKGIFGTPEESQYNMSSANSGSQPFEQEEVAMVEVGKVFQLIDGLIQTLDKQNNLDKSAILALSQLKNKISRIT